MSELYWTPMLSRVEDAAARIANSRLGTALDPNVERLLWELTDAVRAVLHQMGKQHEP